jgi:hypothetical protein
MHYLACFVFKSVRQNSAPFSGCPPDSVPTDHRYLPHLFPERQARDQTFRYANGSIRYLYLSPTLCSLWRISPGVVTSLSFSSGYLSLVWIRLWRYEPPYEHTPLLLWHANDWVDNFIHRPNILLLSYLGFETQLLAVVRFDYLREFCIANHRIDPDDDVQLADLYYTIIWRNRGRGPSKDIQIQWSIHDYSTTIGISQQDLLDGLYPYRGCICMLIILVIRNPPLHLIALAYWQCRRGPFDCSDHDDSCKRSLVSTATHPHNRSYWKLGNESIGSRMTS